MTEALVTTDGPIRRFSDSGIQAAVDQALEGLTPGTNGAVIAYADGSGARLAVVGKLGEQWSVVGVLEKPWNGGLDGQAAVRWTW